MKNKKRRKKKWNNWKKKQTNEQFKLELSKQIKRAKEDFKKMIDEMPDEVFMDFSILLTEFFEDMEDWCDEEFEDDDDYEYWEDESEEFYNDGKDNVVQFPIGNDEDLPF